MNRGKPLSSTCGITGCQEPTAWDLKETVSYGKPRTKAVYHRAYCDLHFEDGERMLHDITDEIPEREKQGFKITVYLKRTKVWKKPPQAENVRR